MSPPVLALERVSYGTPDGRVLAKNLTLRLREGQCLLVSGPNGCGKSTLLKAVLGRAPLTEGHLIAPPRIAYIPQLENTDVHLPFTLRDVLEAAAPEMSPAALAAEINRLGLLPADRLDVAWNTASGGERKRTLLTRALLGNPELLLFDEPMNHLDPSSRSAVLEALSRFLSESPRRAAVLVCHQGLSIDEKHKLDTVALEYGA